MRKCFYNTNLSESSTGSRPAFTTIETVGNKIRVISVKNAIWSAVPNIGVIVAGDPVTVGLSLATHIEAHRGRRENTKAVTNEFCGSSQIVFLT